MKVYRPSSVGRRFTLHVAPGATYPITDWLLPDGKPKQISVTFEHGVALVPDNLAQYLIDQKYAQRSPLILPEGA